ncbi:hypothetical protein CEXT_752381 [Caerostris extrusa]|uniref:Uncharacterized protein n=1 Tax=Caerostris extrusa TaxID=172846 RepID=A0AAV4SEP2_CAEEX|nr:hypothetical protein CEXT_752381 [Caerostris extrusa]
MQLYCVKSRIPAIRPKGVKETTTFVKIAKVNDSLHYDQMLYVEKLLRYGTKKVKRGVICFLQASINFLGLFNQQLTFHHFNKQKTNPAGNTVN